MPQVIVFEHANFHGAHKHVFGSEANLNAGDDSFFNDRISSMVVLEGRWDFFIDSNFVGKLGGTLGPGQYPSMNVLGGNANDRISSMRSV